MENRETLLRRIRALAAKTVANGCTEAEAFSAAELLARLVDKYGFTPADLGAPAERLTDETVQAEKRSSGNEQYAGAVAKYCDCEVFRRDAPGGGKEFVFFGTEPDALMCRYIMALLGTASNSGFRAYMVAAMTDAPYAGFRADRQAMAADRKAYDVGFCERIRVRLAEMKRARNAEVDKGTGRTGGALVAVKNALVTEEYAKRYKTKARRNGSFSYKSGAAYAASQRTGASVAINPGVGAGGRALAIS
jgi:hypothetical protein